MLMTKKKTATHVGPTEKIAPGYVIINIATSSGGLKYLREHLGEEKEGERVETEYKTNKVVDNVAVVKEIDAAVKEADYILRSNCVKTAFGYFATDAKLVEVQKKIEALKGQMEHLNRKAKVLGSAHRGNIGIIAARLDIANADTMRECYRVVRETLEGIYEALLRGDVRDIKDKDDNISARGQLRPAMLRARNLESMAIGLAGESIKRALECAKVARKQILERIENGATPEEAGRAVDLTEIETAITWFGDGFGGGS
jgi:hypothetical protein